MMEEALEQMQWQLLYMQLLIAETETLILLSRNFLMQTLTLLKSMQKILT